MKYLFLILIFPFATSAAAQSQSETVQEKLIIQEGSENLILAQLLGFDSSFFRVEQVGNQNQFQANDGTNVLALQEGNNNSIILANGASQTEGTLSLIQIGNDNSLESYGTNSIIEQATIIQQGNSLELTIINE